jgi:hypothetical protein
MDLRQGTCNLAWAGAEALGVDLPDSVNFINNTCDKFEGMARG